jgi:hypothetical protein
VSLHALAFRNPCSRTTPSADRKTGTGQKPKRGAHSVERAPLRNRVVGTYPARPLGRHQAKTERPSYKMRFANFDVIALHPLRYALRYDNSSHRRCVAECGLAAAHRAPRCGARRKATGQACRAPAMPNGRCHKHGGASTGARTAEGLARCRAAPWKHGARAADMRAAARLRGKARQVLAVSRPCFRTSVRREPDRGGGSSTALVCWSW